MIEHSRDKLSINEMFLKDVQSVIEKSDSMKHSGKPSRTYKPSSCVCLRMMYFMVTGADLDPGRTDYQSIGMADTGTRRHVAIQEALMQLSELGYDWEYIDVEEYIKDKQLNGKCSDIIIVGKSGPETKLRNTKLNMNFMCDGIMRQKSTGRYILFEFKNQISFKANNKEDVDTEHKPQAALYCLNLDLEDVFFLYENRDNCELHCFLLHISDEDKNAQLAKLQECDTYVENLIPPPRHKDLKPCRWCSYKVMCKRCG